MHALRDWKETPRSLSKGGEQRALNFWMLTMRWDKSVKMQSQRPLPPPPPSPLCLGLVEEEGAAREDCFIGGRAGAHVADGQGAGNLGLLAHLSSS